MYAVAGVTGHTGMHVAQSLLERGVKVRALIHNPEKGKDLAANGAELWPTVLDDWESLQGALIDVESLYFLVPSKMNARDMEAHYRTHVDSLIKALIGTPVKHIVFLSAWGAHLGDRVFSMLHDAEQRLQALGTPCTCLRASFFMENTLMTLSSMENEGILPTFFPPEMKMPMVAAKDIGKLAADKLLQGPTSAPIIELTGPTNYSMEDVALAFSRSLSKPIEVKHIPLSGVRPAIEQMGGSESFAAFYERMVSEFEAGYLGPEFPTVVSNGPTSLTDFVPAAIKNARAYIS